MFIYFIVINVLGVLSIIFYNLTSRKPGDFLLVLTLTLAAPVPMLIAGIISLVQLIERKKEIRNENRNN